MIVAFRLVPDLQAQDGGGWTMVLHTYLSGTYPPTSQYLQSYDEWRTLGIGNIQVNLCIVPVAFRWYNAL